MALGVLGIPVLGVIAWALGFATSRRLAGEDEVRALLLHKDPAATAAEVLVDAQGRAALALLSDGRLYAVQVLGDRLVDRIIPMHSVRLLRRKLDQRRSLTMMTLATNDFSFPALHLRSQQAEPPAWLERLQRAGA